MGAGISRFSLRATKANAVVAEISDMRQWRAREKGEKGMKCRDGKGSVRVWGGYFLRCYCSKMWREGGRKDIGCHFRDTVPELVVSKSVRYIS